MRFWPRRRVPFIPQMEVSECGAACLAMILGHYGHHAPLADVRTACGVSSFGANVKTILEAARGYRMECEAVKVDAVNLEDLPLPAILHWDFSHFMVLESVSGEWVKVTDPAIGRRRLSHADVDKFFTGVAIVFAPDDGFVKRPEKRPSLGRYLDNARTSIPNLAQILGASIMLQVIGIFLPVANQIVIDHVITPRQDAWLVGIAIGLTAALIGKVMIGLVRSWVIQGLQTFLDQSLMSGFVEHLLHLPLSFFLQREPGDLMQRVQANTQIRNLFSTGVVTSVLDVFLLIGYAALMIVYSLKLAAVIMVIATIRVALLLRLRDRNDSAMSAEQAALGKENGALVEVLSNLEMVKSSGSEAAMTARWGDRLINRMNASLERQRISIGSDQAMVMFQGLSYAMIYGIGGSEVISERMSVGVFASFITLHALFMAPLESMLNAIARIQYMGVHLARLDDILETDRERTGKAMPESIAGAIDVIGVNFSYAPGMPPAVLDASVSIAPGEKVALVGMSGAGKSTLARILLGMHVPSAGDIRFDGITIHDLDLAALRNRMGVVLQETFFFDDTIMSNLRLNDPAIPMDRLRAACAEACVLDVIDALPDGFGSRMGENGNLFSGGQRQRMSLARALAHDPAILLLDEATSALDLETERRLHSNLAARGCTRIVIAHRLATVMDADRILVMHNGSIVQSGDYRTLCSEPGTFRTIVRAMGGDA